MGLLPETNPFRDTTSQVTAGTPSRLHSSSSAPLYNAPASLWHMIFEEVLSVMCFAIK